MKTYTTQQGDMWDSISQKVYGNSLGMARLIHANIEHIEVGVFSAGITIKVPEDETAQIIAEKAPWFK